MCQPGDEPRHPDVIRLSKTNLKLQPCNLWHVEHQNEGIACRL